MITIHTTKELIQYILTLNNRLVLTLSRTDRVYILIDTIIDIKITNVRPSPRPITITR